MQFRQREEAFGNVAAGNQAVLNNQKDKIHRLS
jgi:hypothetical protein